MRYAQGGGLTDERRAFREKLRLEAAERFQQGDENAVTAHGLRVGVRSVQRWRRAGPQVGPRALAPTWPASLPLLSDELFAVLERELFQGTGRAWPASRPDQTWTLSRIKTLTGRRFHESYTVQGAAALLRRHGWTCQVPARRAIERDGAAVAGWMKETWPQAEGPWRRSTPDSSSRTKPGSR